MIERAPGRRRREQRTISATRTRYDELGGHVVALAPAPTGYGSAASTRRATGMRYSSGSEDFHAQYTLGEVRDQSRAFDRNNGIYQSIVTRLADFILGEGLKLQAQTGDAELDARLEARWATWWTQGRPDARELDAGPEIERQLLRCGLVDGDYLVVRDDERGKIQIIPAERIGNVRRTTAEGARIIDGVEIDEVGKVRAYYVLEYGRNGELRQSNPRRIAAEEAELYANRRRNDQTRGEPALQAMFANLHRLNDTCDSEAAAWQLNSRIALLVTKEEGPAAVDALTQTNTDAADDDVDQRQLNIGDAIVFFGKKGEKIEGMARNVPGGNFSDTVKMFMRLTGLPVGVSLEFLLLLWSDTNYSSGRASIKQVGRSIIRWSRMIRETLSMIYRWKLGIWLAEEPRAAAAPEPFKHIWSGHPYPAMDEQKEMEALQAKMEGGVTSQTRACHAMGTEFDDVLAERASELNKAAELVQVHNAAHSDPRQQITIQEICPFLRQQKAGTGAGNPAANTAGKGGGAGNEPPPQAPEGDEGDGQE